MGRSSREIWAEVHCGRNSQAMDRVEPMEGGEGGVLAPHGKAPAWHYEALDSPATRTVPASGALAVEYGKLLFPSFSSQKLPDASLQHFPGTNSMETFHISLEENERLDPIFPPSECKDEYLEEDEEGEAYEHTTQRDLRRINGNMNDIQVSYGPSEWSKSHSTYDPQPMEFMEENVGLTHVYNLVPSYIGLFSIFWPISLLKDIAYETNCFVRSLDNEGKAWRRKGWYLVTWKELRVFLAMILYMDMKKLPNMKAYWTKSEKLFYDKEIASLFSRQRFLALLKCLYITDPATYTIDKNDLEYDKMHQTRSLINTIQDSCKRNWHLGQFITIDETMVRYKGKYCLARQYMPKK